MSRYTDALKIGFENTFASYVYAGVGASDLADHRQGLALEVLHRSTSDLITDYGDMPEELAVIISDHCTVRQGVDTFLRSHSLSRLVEDCDESALQELRKDLLERIAVGNAPLVCGVEGHSLNVLYSTNEGALLYVQVTYLLHWAARQKAYKGLIGNNAQQEREVIPVISVAHNQKEVSEAMEEMHEMNEEVEPAQADTTALALRLDRQQDNASLALTLREVLRPGPSQEQFSTLVRDNPEAAYGALQRYRELGLGSRVAANILELITDEAEDVDEACDLLNKHLSPAQQAELIAARGDLSSTAAMVCDLGTFLAAMAEDIQESITYVAFDGGRVDDLHESSQMAFKCHLVLGWAMKARDREDYDEFLDSRFGSSSKVRDFVLVALWHDQGSPEDLDEITADAFEDLGIDGEMARDRLGRLIDSKKMPRLNKQGLLKLVAAKTKRRKRLEQEDLAIRARAATDKAVDELEI
jgi:hypothetical protein